MCTTGNVVAFNGSASQGLFTWRHGVLLGVVLGVL
jgi:hypothetical protein